MFQMKIYTLWRHRTIRVVLSANDTIYSFKLINFHNDYERSYSTHNIVLVVTDYSWRYYLCSTSIPNRSLIDMWSYVSVYSWQVRFRFWVLYSSLMPKCRDYLFYLFFSVRLLSVLRGHSRFFSSPPQRPISSDFEGFSIPDFIHYIFTLEKEPEFLFSMFSAKQVNYWYHFYNVFGMTRSWGLNPWPPVLEASTLPLG